ncbi:MAG: menaquinone biosynthesis decarboxylase [Candidatus Hydrothermarchaeota archaeon]|nr:MAG: menaquinone biosynthesis decarboxylase [Candidatus Hydrothermarchaeota archaeon]
MPYEDLREFINVLEDKGMLRRVKTRVSAELEITEILDRVVKANGPALLFENVKGYDIPIVANIFGSMERMKLALEVERFESIGEKLLEFLKPEIPRGITAKVKAIGKVKEILSYPPKLVKHAPCKEVVLEGEKASLKKFPILKCWPKDGGKFITLPLVITKDPETRERNMGMYRMHVYDERTTGMHWHVHKDGAKHYRKAEELGEELEVAVALGSDPATIFSATAPLPFDELLFSGFLRKKPVKLVKCETVDLEVPANAEIVLEGYVKPKERRIEGPFGDHTGFYSKADYYPVFHITCITHREKPIYPATIVGKPPMEDSYIGKAIERIFLPLIKFNLPEVTDINLPIEGVFHNLAIVSIDKQYPGHAKKVMFALWGMGQMMFTKTIIVVDKDVDVHNLSEVIWAVSNRFDPKRDVVIVEGTPADALDHTTPLPHYGSKMGIDATVKWKEEGIAEEWPEEIEMSKEIKELVSKKWKSYGI